MQVAAVLGEESVTYRELSERIKCFASSITNKFGFSKGDVLAIMAPNGIEWIVAFYGTLLAGQPAPLCFSIAAFLWQSM